MHASGAETCTSRRRKLLSNLAAAANVNVPSWERRFWQRDAAAAEKVQMQYLLRQEKKLSMDEAGFYTEEDDEVLDLVNIAAACTHELSIGIGVPSAYRAHATKGAKTPMNSLKTFDFETGDFVTLSLCDTDRDRTSIHKINKVAAPREYQNNLQEKVWLRKKRLLIRETHEEALRNWRSYESLLNIRAKACEGSGGGAGEAAGEEVEGGGQIAGADAAASGYCNLLATLQQAGYVPVARTPKQHVWDLPPASTSPGYASASDEADDNGWSKLMYLAVGSDLYNRQFHPQDMALRLAEFEIDARKANLEFCSLSVVDRHLHKTPLALAVEYKNLPMVSLLLSKKADAGKGVIFDSCNMALSGNNGGPGQLPGGAAAPVEKGLKNAACTPLEYVTTCMLREEEARKQMELEGDCSSPASRRSAGSVSEDSAVAEKCVYREIRELLLRHGWKE
eukprot:g6296.t1